MRIFSLLLVLWIVVICCLGQVPWQFKTLRFDEDYSNVSLDSVPLFYSKVKHFTISRNIYLSAGGEVRYQRFKVEREDWGETSASSDGYLLARHLLHLDFHAVKAFRIFSQLQNSLAFDKLDVSSLDENPLELHQLFMDYIFSIQTDATITLRLGRQELLYGSQRLISVRNGPNNRQSFDGLKAMVDARLFRLDMWYSHFVVARNGSFNDLSDEHTRLWGGYWLKKNVNVFGNIDLYYIGLMKQPALFDDGIGKELRHSLGARAWKIQGPLQFDIEGVYQFGSLSKQEINAWTISLKAIYGFENAKLNPQVGLKTEVISGDLQYHDGNINTFNPLFPSGAYFGLAALFGPSNLVDFHPSLSLELNERIFWNLDYDIFWRNSRNDGIYTNSGVLIYSGRGNPHFFIGQQLSTNFSYSPCSFFNIGGEFKWFLSGDFLKDAGPGKDILFASCSTRIVF